ncbi:MAG TPA: glutamyl-tRNA reductase [Vicinamibacterales bacterium]|nr:glutamyl-tRNA reductase [Vicinamibacterales bacterium]
MQLLLVGVSHRTAPIELRERLDFSARGVDRALTALAGSDVHREATIVSTCNRVELYVGCDEPNAARAAIQQFLSEFHGIPGEQLAPHVYSKTGQEAVAHLYRVASGLDSLVMGEPQILGQVKDAFGVASQMGCTGPLLNKLFHSAFATGKRVRSETALAEGAVSVSYAAVELARKIFGNLKGRTVVVIGAGEMGKLTAVHMQSQGIGRLIITSRTAAHASALAQSIGGSAMPWEALSTTLVEADILITATGASMPIISRQLIAQTMKARRQRPLFIIDIAVPRDVEGDAGDLEQVFLYNIDDLQAVVQENISKRGTEASEAEKIIAQEVARFTTWLNSRGAVPTIVALRHRFESIRQSELRRLEPKMASLPPEARARVDEITRLFMEKLLINPTEQLKSASDADTVATYSDALTRLFGLAGEEPDDTLTSAGARTTKKPAQ